MLNVSVDWQIKCISSASITSCVHCTLHTATPQLLPHSVVYFSFGIFLRNGSCQDSNKAGLMSEIDNSVRLYEEAWKQANVLLNYGFNK